MHNYAYLKIIRFTLNGFWVYSIMQFYVKLLLDQKNLFFTDVLENENNTAKNDNDKSVFRPTLLLNTLKVKLSNKSIPYIFSAAYSRAQAFSNKIYIYSNKK
jgi:hypothetical protein